MRIETEQQAINRIKAMVEQGLKHYDLPKTYCRVVVENYSGRSAGQCRYHPDGSYIIRINKAFLSNHPDSIDETIKHEVAHMIDHMQTGHMSHGANWKKIMRECFLVRNPSATHSMDTSKIQSTNDRYTLVYCDKCKKQMYMSKVRANRVLRNERGYHHAGCGGTIKLGKYEETKQTKEEG